MLAAGNGAAMHATASELSDLTFDNSLVRELPGDAEPLNFRREVHGAVHSAVAPASVKAPRLVALSDEVAALLDLDVAGLAENADDPRAQHLARVLSGNETLAGMQPYAACYGGHQFGNWAGQLGDGRAITLGEVVSRAGQRWELQLKGAGPTPYSRTGDGRAVMRSSVREFLCSEAMYHLGVPTTRALSLVDTGDTVVRDMFYDGNARPEPGAIVCRVAPSFLRFGNFELPASRGDASLLKRLADYAITTHFPHLGAPNPDVYCAWLAEVAARTAVMVSHWMRVGFVHGVMNTDNMSILGLTIDYGPYGWLEGFDPNWTPNTTDAHGRRYRFGNQTAIAGWNLVRFANALYPLVEAVEPLQTALDTFDCEVQSAQSTALAAKLGLTATLSGDDPLVAALFKLLTITETDMTLFYRGLADVPSTSDATDDAIIAPLLPAYYTDLDAAVREHTLAWLRRYAARVRSEAVPDAERRVRMNAVNPKYVLRNYLAQLAIDAAEQGDGSKVRELLEVMRRPYDEQPGREEYAKKRPEWARNRPGCSMLSCSS